MPFMEITGIVGTVRSTWISCVEEIHTFLKLQQMVYTLANKIKWLNKE
jgi:hypothetical protein